jgi:uncharacterized protein (UPF0371 family)
MKIINNKKKETLFISTFNSENFMKNRVRIDLRVIYKQKIMALYEIYRKYLSTERTLTHCCII